jgi:hypothetical protein
MDETTDQIESRIDQTREDLKSNLEELESRMKAVTDWRTHVGRHPLPMIIAALLGGVVLSTLIGRRG